MSAVVRRARVPGTILAALLVCIAWWPAVATAAATKDQPALQRPPTLEERRGVRKSHARAGDASIESTPSPLAAAPLTMDVERYTISILVTLPGPGLGRVDGTVRIQARPVGGPATTLTFGLDSVMSLSSVRKTGGALLATSRLGNTVQVTLDRSYAVGELIDLTVTYGGTPPSVNVSGLAFAFRTHGAGTPGQGPIVSSLSQPDFAPAWWPCLDRPDDKAIVDMDLRVPAALTGVSNGMLVANILNGDGTRTFQWRSVYPISTYLVSVAISNYVTWTDFYTPVTGGPVMPVQHWVYPEHETAARTDLNVTVPMLTFFSNTYGEYPFVAEKYGHAIFPFGGGMEHQTVTSYGGGLIRGDHLYDWIVAHELAHQWFGDAIGPAEWPEIWLNEGFATYGEVLWQEHLGGAAAMRNYVQSLDSRPFGCPVYDPLPECDDLFDHTVYDKGAWVLHMLRHVVGDAAFFQGLRNYYTAFNGSSATTPGFLATMEVASGRDLDAFFDRWVYQMGEPVYAFGWTAASTPAGWVTHVHIDQQQGGILFEMPVDIRVSWNEGSQTFVVNNTSFGQDTALPPVPGQPTQVVFDPDLWILKTLNLFTPPDGDGDGVPDTADNCSGASNPAQEDLDGDGLGNACDPDLDGDGRANGADCAPADPTAQDPPGTEVSGVTMNGALAATIAWTPLGGAPPTWSYDVLRGSLLALRAAGNLSGLACFAGSQPPSSLPDLTAPPPGDGLYYFVRARNPCGTGPVGNSSNGTPRPSPACP
ncbi:MAG TPA: M1 family aminopeptidase [Candidatus Polarisedimenticolia bacterium]|nr:M1 family aminopeptidase [Candidatus Polarisedimenticolia bacterium]